MHDDGPLKQIPVDLLQRGRYQPRVDIRQDSLEELANSIKAQGVVQPIVARPIGTSRRFAALRDRRRRAALASGADGGLEDIPAIVRDIPDENAIAMALIENIQREDLNPLEEARALDRLIREFDLTHAEAAEAVGRSRASVSNLLRLLDLSDKVKPCWRNARDRDGPCARTAVDRTAVQQHDAARQVVRKGLSVRETERLVKRMLEGKPDARPSQQGA